MPRKIKKACSKQGCAAVTTDKSGYCDKCKPKHSGWGKHSKGKSNTERGYGWSWRKLRSTILKRDNYLCRHCLAKGRAVPGNQVDHILPKSQGGSDDPSNLQTLCTDCHNIKTNKESRQQGGG